jgi:hypothetical protein
MRTAPPPVELELGRALGERAFEAALYALAAAVLAAWASARWSETGSAGALGWVVAVAAAALAAGLSWRLGPERPQRLRWDGQCWRLDDRAWGWIGEAGRLSVMMDLGNWMLFRFDSASQGNAGPPQVSLLPLGGAEPAHKGPTGALWLAKAIWPASRMADAATRRPWGRSQARARWFGVGAHQAGPAWHLLRSAVYGAGDHPTRAGAPPASP